MGVVKIKDGDGNQVFLEVVGDGTSSNPFTMVPANIQSSRAYGDLAGKEGIAIIGNNPSVGTTFVDVNDFGGVEAIPTGVETIEVISDDTNDTAGGSGARTLLLTYLDVDFVKKTEVITMNGTVAVPIGITPLRYKSLILLTSGGSSNTGTITLRVVAGPITRLQIKPGNGITFSSLFTVEKGKEFITENVVVFVPKNQDIELRTRIRPPGANAAWVSSGTIPVYQGSAVLPTHAPLVFGEKTDILFQAKSTNAGINVTVFLEGEQKDV